jgi:hypothetical protein
VLFEQAVTVRSFRWSRSQRHVPGWWWLATTGSRASLRIAANRAGLSAARVTIRDGCRAFRCSPSRTCPTSGRTCSART